MISEPTCPYIETHTVKKDETGHLYCVDHREGDLGAPLYTSRIEELQRQKTIQVDLVYREKVEEMQSDRTITNIQLKQYFENFENKNLRIDVLQKVLGPTDSNKKGLIKLNWPQDPEKQTAVIPSSYMRRLSTYTRERWRQKRLRGEDGTPLIRFWTDGEYDPEVEKEKREARKIQRQYEKERKGMAKSHLQFQKDNKKGKWAEKE